MSHEERTELKLFLQGTLFELNKVADQIREMKDYSEQSEYLLCLRELVLEQIGNNKNEDSSHSAHAAR